MNPIHCEREAEITEALRLETMNSALRIHASSCAICSDAAVVSKFLLSEDAAAPVPPDSDFIWWKAQLTRKQMAVEQATQSIALVKKLAYLGISATVLWLVLVPDHLWSTIGGLSNYEVLSTGGFRESVLFVAAGTLLCTLLGSVYLVRLKE